MITERFIAPALTFLLLIAGHVAIASAMLGGPRAVPAEAVAAQPVIQLEAVIVTGKRTS